MKEIQLGRGYVALVDDEDYERVNAHKWYIFNPQLSKTTYAQRNARPVGLMHRFILDAPEGTRVDHVDGNGLNNVRSNLRLASHADNMRNRRKAVNNTSGYIGVYWDKHKSKWRARVRVNNKNNHIGYFDDLVLAAKARDTAALDLHGEFAVLNFPRVNP